MSLVLQAGDRSKLFALMSEAEVSHYEALVLDHIEATGKKYKNLAAVIRVWWRRDQQKRGVVRLGAPRPIESPSERLDRAKAILAVKIREYNYWHMDAAKHTHGPDCQGGRVCPWTSHKEPLIPLLGEILEKLQNG